MRIPVCVCVVVALVLVAPEPACAQGSFGVKGGAALAAVSTSGANSYETDAQVGPSIGVFGAIELRSQVRLQPELLFSVRRFRIAGGPVEIESRGFEVPILLHVRAAGARRVRPVFFAGPQISVITRVTQSIDGSDRDISDLIATIDAGVTAGAGIEVAAGRGALTFDARFTLGLKDLSRTGEPRVNSHGFAFLAGYRF